MKIGVLAGYGVFLARGLETAAQAVEQVQHALPPIVNWIASFHDFCRRHDAAPLERTEDQVVRKGGRIARDPFFGFQDGAERRKRPVATCKRIGLRFPHRFDGHTETFLA